MLKANPPEEHNTLIPRGSQVVVATNTCVPRNEDTEKIPALIGCAFTRFELRSDGTTVLEFDPHGCITYSPRFGVEITANIAATTTSQPIGKG